MLENEEVDIDYFTPSSRLVSIYYYILIYIFMIIISQWFFISSTSLSKIFRKNIQTEEGQENSTLKYVPPLPTQTHKPDEEKTTQQVLYVATVNAYEW